MSDIVYIKEKIKMDKEKRKEIYENFIKRGADKPLPHTPVAETTTGSVDKTISNIELELEMESLLESTISKVDMIATTMSQSTYGIQSQLIYGATCITVGTVLLSCVGIYGLGRYTYNVFK